MQLRTCPVGLGGGSPEAPRAAGLLLPALGARFSTPSDAGRPALGVAVARQPPALALQRLAGNVFVFQSAMWAALMHAEFVGGSCMATALLACAHGWIDQRAVASVVHQKKKAWGV